MKKLNELLELAEQEKLDELDKGNRFKDITGNRYGKLTVINIRCQTKNKEYVWNCLCDCGNKYHASHSSLQVAVGIAFILASQEK